MIYDALRFDSIRGCCTIRRVLLLLYCTRAEFHRMMMARVEPPPTSVPASPVKSSANDAKLSKADAKKLEKQREKERKDREKAEKERLKREAKEKKKSK